MGRTKISDLEGALNERDEFLIKSIVSIRNTLERCIDEMEFRGTPEHGFAMRLTRQSIADTQAIEGILLNRKK